MQVSYRAGQPIMHWLAAGPFVLDVSDRYTDNYIVPFADYADLWTAAEASAGQIHDVREGESLSLYGQSHPWRLLQVHEAEQRLTWAKFGTEASLLTTFVTQRIRVDTPGDVPFHVSYNGSVQLRVNGKVVLEDKQVGRVGGKVDIAVPLQAGWNEVTALLFNVHLHCLNVLQLTLDRACEVMLPLYPIDEALRRDIERSLGSFYLSDTILVPGQSLWLESGPLPEAAAFTWMTTGTPKGKARFSLSEGGIDKANDRHALCAHGDLPGAGAYEVTVACRIGDHIIPGQPLSFQRVDFMNQPEGLPAQARKAYLLARYADDTQAHIRTAAYRALCQLASGKEAAIDEGALHSVIDYINDRYDCADFAMHGLLRLHMKYGTHPALSEGLRARIKDCILGFKYWVDEPGRSLMFTRSENHEILFHSAEYLAGLAFPLELFPSSGQNGLFHELKGRVRAERWIREKGHYGFTEWHSNTYYEEDMIAMLNIWEFGEENGYLRQYARQLLDLITLFIASNSYQGIMATTHGRCYEGAVMHPYTESMSRINWLLFGEPHRLDTQFSIGAATLADSPYLPPETARAMAAEPTLDTQSRMGLFRSKGLGGINCATYRTAHYMVSGLVESNYGEHGAQVQAGQALLAGEVPVFVTCFADRSPTTRPSYWGGQHIIPKTIAHRNLLAYIVNMEGQVGYSHCYFPMAQMDETQTRGPWLFGRKGDAYIAVYSQMPYEMVTGGQYKHRELLCMEKRNIWLLELGDSTQYSGFAAFTDAISAAHVAAEGNCLRYASPSCGDIFLGWAEACTHNGTPFLADDFPLISNPYAYGVYGSGLIALKDAPGRHLNFF